MKFGHIAADITSHPKLFITLPGILPPAGDTLDWTLQAAMTIEISFKGKEPRSGGISWGQFVVFLRWVDKEPSVAFNNTIS